MAVGTADADKAHLPGASSVVGSGRYHLFAILGRGGMADVYLGVSQGLKGFNRLVVVKMLREGLVQDESFVSMFLDEGRLAARLNHPNVIHTYEIGEADGTYFLAMEYLDGQPISHITASLHNDGRKVLPELWVKVVSEALAGLHYAHELCDYDGTSLGVIHRDVSPHNLFITYDGRIKLVDFGVAKATLNQAQTETGILKGKIAYMAPEQAMGHAVDRRADVFGMGIVLWELVAGRRLLIGDAVVTLHKLLNEPIPALADVAPGVDAELSAIVMKSLQKEPAERYQTAQEMRAALDAWLRARDAAIDETRIGALVTELFEKQRAGLQLQIETCMSDAASHPGTVGTLTFGSGSQPSVTSGPRSVRRGPAEEGETLARIPTVSDVAAVKGANERKGPSAVTFAGVFALLALCFGLALWLRTQTEPPRVATPPPASANAPTKVGLTIVAAPPEAILFFDGERLVGNPYVGTLTKDDKEHELRAEAPGFATTERTVRAQNDATYELALLPVPPPPVQASSEPPKPTKPPRGNAIARPPSSPQPNPSLPPLEQDPWKSR